MVRWEQVVQGFGGDGRRRSRSLPFASLEGRRCARGQAFASLRMTNCRRQLRNEVAQLVQALLIILYGVVSNAADLVCITAPPSVSAVHRLARGALHQVGPASPMNEVPFTMRITSESAGRYAPPATH